MNLYLSLFEKNSKRIKQILRHVGININYTSHCEANAKVTYRVNTSKVKFGSHFFKCENNLIPVHSYFNGYKNLTFSLELCAFERVFVSNLHLSAMRGNIKLIYSLL